MRYTLLLPFLLINSTLFAITETGEESSGVPLISIIALGLFLLFFLLKDKFKSSFRANKTALLIALLTIALLAWPFKFFKSDDLEIKTTNSIEK